jgi:GTP-binding protein
MTTSSTSRVFTLAIVGRPNVGKSTLFNRLVGRRRAIVGDEPGITRDRLYGEGDWRGRRLRIVDTGGIVPDDKEFIPAEILRQARVALDEADAVIMVVDGRTELASSDLDLARLLLRTGKPLYLAVNKMDVPKMDPYAEEFRRLGIQELFPISAEHGLGIAELLEAVFEKIATKDTKEHEGQTDEIAETAEEEPREQHGEVAEGMAGEVRVAIIGRPNVGKSTLLNRLTASQRAIVSPIPGTTRDAVDELVERGGKKFRFIDTAGIRRKGKTRLMAEKLSVVMARKHLEAADVALLVLDATEGVAALDANIAGYAHESGRSVIVVVNKWDLVGPPASDDPARPAAYRERPADRAIYEQQVRDGLKFLAYAPVVFISATTGKNTDKLFALVEQVAEARRKRVPTAEINRFLQKVDFQRASVPMSKRVKIYYMTQAAVAPPTFILFTDRAVKLHFSFERFLENQIRRAFGFTGTPIWIKTRGRE